MKNHERGCLRSNNRAVRPAALNSVSERAARTGRNLQTGATLEIAARRAVKFKAGKALKEAVQ